MKFIKSKDTKHLEDTLVATVIEYLADELKVVLFVPGGSNIAVVVSAVKRLADEKNSDRLILMLSDERYGDIGHSDSNYEQFRRAGISHNVTFIPLLDGSNFEDTIAHANTLYQKMLAEAGAVVAFLGMGPDSHIAGILPHAPVIESGNVVDGYDGGTYRRITLTPLGLSMMSNIIVGTFGKEKQQALEALKHEEAPVEDQPVQFLKTLENVLVFNDHVGGEI